MTRRPDSAIVLLVCAFLVPACALQVPDRPNVVLFIIDDLGWKDLSITGSELYETPNIDALAQGGVRFERFYSDSPVCSPTRAALMTGKHPAALHITNWIGGDQKGQLIQAEYERQLPLEEATIGDTFREAGYRTAFIGKWHLGGEGFGPLAQGFDINVGGHAAGQPASYFWPYKRDGGSPFDVPHLEKGEPGEYLTDRLTDEAINFIRDSSDQPFFLVLSHYSVHTPIQAKEDITAAIQARLETNPVCPENADTPLFDNDPAWSTTRTCQNNAAYAAMVESTDQSIGRIRETLSAIGLAENTIIFFVSDNGGLSSLAGDRASGPTSNRPLRAGKGYLYEGGVRIPMIVSGPGIPGGGVRNSASSTMDVAPTLYELAGVKPVAEGRNTAAQNANWQNADRQNASQQNVNEQIGDGSTGRSLVPEIFEPDSLPDRLLFFHFPHYHGSGNRPSGSVLAGRYKLIEWFETGQLELYDLTSDEGEQINLATTRPALADSLLKRLQTWRANVNANMPSLNPEWEAASK